MRRWRTLGGSLAPPRRQGWWTGAGVALEVVATALVVYCAAKYGDRSTLPHAAVALLVAAGVIELAGALTLSRALAPGRVLFALAVPLFFVWPVILIGLVAVFVLTLSSGDSMALFGSGGGRVRETKRGRKRREKLAKQYRSLD
jgi:quinol-cytochrome oxidoreductase complex cytochrome b subunit